VTAETSGRRVTFRDVLANREFRALYIAQALSIIGDEFARIAVALLVFSTSHSPLLTAVSYGVTYLPWLAGGPFLSTLADRYPRRTVMLVCDATRALLILGVALPHPPIWLALTLVTAVTLFGPPFIAARAAVLPDIIGEGEPYSVSFTLMNTTGNVCVVLGFAVGGIVVAASGARMAIVVDSATFVLSALLILRSLRHRPAAAAGGRQVLADLKDGATIVFGDSYLRWLVVVSWVVMGAAITTESLAVPYAHAHGAGAATAGLLTAALPLGLVAGALVVGRFMAPEAAVRLLPTMALGMPAVLALTATNPPPAVAGIVWFLSGALSAAQVTANRVFVTRLRSEVRGRAFGVASSGIAAAQGTCAIACGAIAQRVGPAIAISDIALPALAILIIMSLRRFSFKNSASAPISHESHNQDREKVQPPTQAQSRVRVWMLCLGLSIIAIGLTPFLPGRPLVNIHLAAWWLLLLFVIAIASPLHFIFRRQAWSVHLDAVPLVIGLLFLPALQLLLVQLVAIGFAHGVLRRQPLIRLTFNVAASAVYTISAILVFRVVAPSGGGVHPRTWPAAFVAVFVDELVSVFLVIVVVYLSEGVWTIRQSAPALISGPGIGLLNTFLALSTAAALSYDVATAWAITVFLILSVAAVRTYHRLADRHAALDKLYVIARELGPIAADAKDLAPALAQLRRLLRAEALELAMASPDPGFVSVVKVFEDATGEGTDVSDRPLNEDYRQLLEGSDAALFRSPGRRRLAQRAARPDDDRIAVRLGSRDRVSAVLVAKHRVGDVGPFEHADMRLLEAAGEQLSAALEKGRLIESLRHAATRDSLTDLPNLDSLREFLNTMLDGSSGGVLLLLDVDRFHELNDTLGHDAGDAILVEVARRLEAAPSQGALVARVGGDQFAMAIPGQAGAEVARLAALAVKSRIDGPLRFPSFSADLRVTVGVARAPDHGSDAATVLRRAEMAMTVAKGSSNAIAEWEPHFEQDGSRRLQVLAGLRAALSENALTAEFQPKLRVGTGEVTGFEALVRWRHPELGPVPPAEFVPLAEASGLISALTSGVLRVALDTCRHWHDLGRPVGVAVNISARSLDDPVLVGQVAAMLTASGVEPRWLTLEITESSVMENAARSIDVLRQLRSLGVRLSIDDFGTGYSSLHQLRGLPVHEVKIDKAFVDHVDGDGADRAVVRAIVELCDSLGLATVAEGVEHAAQAYVLESLGVQQVQGYFYGRPMTEPAATEWLAPRVVAARDEPPSDVPRG
jgi:diguanylate cyclase (GGDEF)-like protein